MSDGIDYVLDIEPGGGHRGKGEMGGGSHRPWIFWQEGPVSATYLLHGFFDVNVVDEHPSNLRAIEEEFPPRVGLCSAWQIFLVDSEDVLWEVSHDE